MIYKDNFLTFIDSLNYKQILNKNLDINELETIITSNIKPDSQKKISLLTACYIAYINYKINNILFNDYYIYDNCNMSTLEKEYISDTFESTMNRYTNCNHLNGKVGKYYELKPLLSGNILVVLEHGFLKNITESKDNLLNFILDCLCYADKFNSIPYRMLSLYIKIKMNSEYLGQLKSKL